MASRVFPTKNNLINTQRSLALAKLGYDLMDRKRNILLRELMLKIEDAKSIRTDVDKTYAKAYSALQIAQITLGKCDYSAKSVPE